jgi:hypothetical protein
MKNRLMFGFWRCIISIPPFLWEKQLSKAKKQFKNELAIMSTEHRAVHHFVVKELPTLNKPMSPEFVSQQLNMSQQKVKLILNDLHTLMILYKNSKDEIVWAYPVTVDKTPHHVTFSTGEQLYAA